MVNGDTQLDYSRRPPLFLEENYVFWGYYRSFEVGLTKRWFNSSGDVHIIVWGLSDVVATVVWALGKNFPCKTTIRYNLICIDF